MKSPLAQLILIGMVGQALSWDDYIWPLTTIVLWFACLSLKKPIPCGSIIESILLVLGASGAYVAGVATGNNTHFFIGHGLILVQLARLLRPLTPREKYVSLVIACFHLAVACTFLYDPRFLVLFFAAIFTFPRVLHELAADQFSKGPSRFPFTQHWQSYLALMAITTGFFLFFPRASVGQIRLPGSGRVAGEGTLADAVIDPFRSTSAQSGKTLLQVQGQALGYLRVFALVDYDGVQWKSLRKPLLREIDRRNPHPERDLRRKVRVKNPLYLTRILPTDGEVIAIDGEFFRRPRLNSFGAIECESMVNTINNVYEYWIAIDKSTNVLSPNQEARLLRHPPQSEKLKNWLQERTRGVTDPLMQARDLESYLSENFVYKLGAPALSRLNPVDDFVFNERQGHCERFATTLALLLRMKGIPSRVVVGYVPNGRDLFSGWYNIRFKDAHAWTEGYFPGRGWVELDATPRRSVSSSSWDFREAIDTIDFFWNSHIVNYDGLMQKSFISGAIDFVNKLAVWLSRHMSYLFLPSFAIVLFLAIREAFKRLRFRPSSRKQAASIATGYYGDMLKAFRRVGLLKAAQDTPLEFLEKIRQEKMQAFEAARTVTEFFCATRYGEHRVADSELAKIQLNLRQLKKLLKDL